ncbi:lactonase family protein [Pelagicoccus mobilis]|uniref:Lactonase family protein n=1 Tax=Pelagicoccus mobilis TaxID=415221 RepID=A0A934VRP7_9BACT|nr:lactonase family protein [Pelagicoccus mobilis]MBK1879622.1 lactonase family protein [Pelagicoccus mobilis]
MNCRFFLGTYTSTLGHVDGCGPGIVPCEVDSRSGIMTTVGEAVAVENPSYLWLNEKGDRLYSISEICDFEGRDDGALNCFEVAEDGGLRLLQQRSSNGPGPAYCRGEETGSRLLVANYVGSNVNVYPIAEDGLLGEPVSSFKHEGTGPNELRQEAPHPHSIAVMPGNEIVFVGDLGIDQLVGYRLDGLTKCIQKEDALSVRLRGGTGPRHFVVQGALRVLYVALELSSEIACIRFDGDWRQVGEIEYISSHRKGDEATSHPSEILLSPDGRHLYIANRGIDCISGFEIGEGGSLEWLGDFSCVGKTPRHMALSPDGLLLLVAHQDSSSLDSYFRDVESGALKPTGESMAAGTPSYIEFC